MILRFRTHVLFFLPAVYPIWCNISSGGKVIWLRKYMLPFTPLWTPGSLLNINRAKSQGCTSFSSAKVSVCFRACILHTEGWISILVLARAVTATLLVLLFISAFTAFFAAHLFVGILIKRLSVTGWPWKNTEYGWNPVQKLLQLSACTQPPLLLFIISIHFLAIDE